MKLRICKTHPNARVPVYATEGAACFDLHAATVNDMQHIGDDAPPVRINPGDRIAQACLVPTPRCVFEVVEQLAATERGAGGFGSSGRA